MNINKNQINLVNWRDVRRKEGSKKYIRLNVYISLFICSILVITGSIYNSNYNKQYEKNAYLKKEISNLDIKLKTITASENEIKELSSRMNIINSLQSNRSEVVMLLDEIAKTTPKEITLSRLKREGANIKIEGKSISQLDISLYLNKLKVSDFFDDTMLEQVIADKTVNGFERSNFFIQAVEHDKKSSLIKKEDNNDE